MVAARSEAEHRRVPGCSPTSVGRQPDSSRLLVSFHALAGTRGRVKILVHAFVPVARLAMIVASLVTAVVSLGA